ncbi:hypothetical protein MMC19_003040 [Ptychographa xylographoides]|nr:hypothetical protein [Ptychographa xylographoides]
MLQTRRSALRLARKVRHQPQRRHDTTKATTGHSAAAGHHEPTKHAHHPEPQNESFGRGFYLTLASLPLGFALYKFSRNENNSSATSAQPAITRFLDHWSGYKDRWVARNTLHTRMVEQAANDRNLFQNEPPGKMVDLRFPEVFNSGSPYNVQAGQTANLDALVAHYEKKNREAAAKFER